MYIRKNNGPKIEPWGTPASILVQEEYFLFSTTGSFLFDKKSIIKLLPYVVYSAAFSEFLISSFISLYFHSNLFTETNSSLLI